MKKALSLFLVFAFLLTSTVFASPVNFTAPETAAEKAETEINVSDLGSDAELQAKSSAPGLNIFNGLPTAISFEEDADSSFESLFSYSGVASYAIAANPVSDDTDSSANAFSFTSVLTPGSTGENYPGMRMALASEIEAQRPMFVSFKYYKSNPGVPVTDYNVNATNWWVMKNSSGASDIIISKTLTANSGAWAYVNDYVDFTKGGAHPDNIKNIAFQGKNMKSDTTATVFYLDDVAFIPGYKLTYKLNDGTTAIFKTEYVKCNLEGPEGGSTHTLISDVPTDETATFVGWALSADATADDCVTTAELANKDVTLYAVWDGDPSTEVSTEPILEYTFDTDSQGWGAWGSIACTQEDGALKLVRSTTANGAINSPASLGIDTADAKYVMIKLKNETTSPSMKFYYSDGAASFTEANTFSFTMPTEMTDYKILTLKLSDLANWKGTVNKFMVAIYSVEDKPVLIDSIGFYTALPELDIPVEPTLLYDFEDGVQGWYNGGDSAVTASDGVMTFTQNLSSGYSAMYTPGDLGLTPASAKYFVVRVKNTSSSPRIHFYFAPNNSTFSEANSFNLPIEANMTGFKTFVFDATTNAAFKAMSVINKFMINITTQGVCEFDSVGFYAENPIKEVLPVKEYNFESDSEGWSAWGINSTTWKSGGYLSVTCTGSGQGAINSPTSIGLTSDTAKYINIRAKNASSASAVSFYFQGGTSSFTESKKFSYPITPNTSDYVDYVLDMSKIASWQGNVDKFMLQFSGVGGTLDIDYIKFYTELPEDLKPEDVSFSLKLSSSANSITTDKGTVTVTPAVKSTGSGVAKTVSYYTDNNNALVTKNSDGTLTVQGMINGNVKVTAVSDYDKNITDSVTIAISGQADRTAAYDLNMHMYGNSILKHGVAESLGWYGNYGMAASSEEKDYAHRLQYFLSQKYGKVDMTVGNFASFERAIVADDSYDYSTALAFVKTDLTSLSSVPEIVTIQMGENVSASGLTASQYKNAVKQLVQEIQKYAPDAQIVVCTPFWGGDAKVQGMQSLATELGIRIAYLHTLNTDENKAGSAFTNSGVSAHPGDTGMNNIATLIYNELNIDLTENVKPEYVVAPTSFTITAPSDKITTAYGTLQLTVGVTPSEASDAVKWTTSDPDIATVTEAGLVNAKNDGLVTITATSKVNDTKATYDITISGQTPAYTITYNANTTDTVTGLPEANNRAKGETALSTTVPERKYYLFAGWAIDKNATENATVSSLYVVESTTVYAVWKPATSWDFDIDGYKQGITIENGFNVNVLGGKLMAIATDTNESTGNVIKFVSPELNVNSDDYNYFAIKMQNTAKNDTTQVELTITSDVDTYTFTQPVTSIEYTSYNFDISTVSGTIKGFSIKPTNTDCTINIDSMGFAANTVTYNANADGEVTGIPAYEAAPNGKYTVSSATPSRTGYTFVGWATSPTSVLALDSIMVDGDVQLYAIWDSNSHWEFNTLQQFEAGCSLGNTTLIGIENGVASVNGSGSSDPIINLKNVNIDASKFKNMEVRIAYQLNSAESTQLNFYFATTTNGGLSEAKTVGKTLTGKNSDGFVTVKLNMAANSAWTGTVNTLRLDPISGYGNYQIDYIRFTDDANAYVYSIPTGYTTNGNEFAGCKNVLLNGGTIKPEGDVTFENLAVSSGTIDTSDGFVAVKGTFEAAVGSTYGSVDLSQKPAGCPDEYTVSDANGNTISSADLVSGTKYVVDFGKTGTYLIYNAGYTYSAIRRFSADGTITDIEDNALLAHNVASIRSTGVQGIRFMASVNENVFDRDTSTAKLVEYGFVVGRSSVFPEGTQPEISDVYDGKAVMGAAYNAVKHVSYDFLDGRDVFTCVVKNIPMTKEALMEQLVMVPYITVTNGADTYTLYGQSVRRSVLEVADAMEEAGGSDYEANQEYIDSIIILCYDL